MWLIAFLKSRFFFSRELHSPACNNPSFLPDKIYMLQQRPGGILPPHLVTSLLCLPFHPQPDRLVKDKIIKGLRNLLNRLFPAIDQYPPRVPPNHQACRTRFIRMNQLNRVSEFCRNRCSSRPHRVSQNPAGNLLHIQIRKQNHVRRPILYVISVLFQKLSL